jgi:hypothetical protein
MQVLLNSKAAGCLDNFFKDIYRLWPEILMDMP